MLIVSVNNRFEYFCIASEMNANKYNIIISVSKEENCGYFYCVHYNLQYPF